MIVYAAASSEYALAGCAAEKRHKVERLDARGVFAELVERRARRVGGRHLVGGEHADLMIGAAACKIAAARRPFECANFASMRVGSSKKISDAFLLRMSGGGGGRGDERERALACSPARLPAHPLAYP